GRVPKRRTTQVRAPRPCVSGGPRPRDKESKMSRTKSLFCIAGAALGLSASAMAQNSLDQSRSYSNELLADAAGRTSALAETPRTFTVDVHGFLQFRYTWTQLDDDE